MNTKDKLELLWKYLLLAVIVYGIFSLSHRRDHSFVFDHDMPMKHKMIMMKDMDLSGDSTIVINVNGKTLTGKEALKWHDEHMGEMELTIDGEEGGEMEVKVFIDEDGNKKKIIKKTLRKDVETTP